MRMIRIKHDGEEFDTFPPEFFKQYQAEDAIPNGSRVRKINSEPGDAHVDDALATVLGSVAVPAMGEGVIAYMVEWDDVPGLACGIANTRIEEIKNE